MHADFIVNEAKHESSSHLNSANVKSPISRYHENVEYVLIQPEEKERKTLPCLILHLSIGKKKPAMVSSKRNELFSGA